MFKWKEEPHISHVSQKQEVAEFREAGMVKGAIVQI